MSTSIQWTDVTDNIITVKGGGWWCSKISSGCANCYAAALNQNRFYGGNKLAYSGQTPELELRREILSAWARQRKPKKHFVASMTDVFGDWMPEEWIFEFLDAMLAAPEQTFQILTKRPEIMHEKVWKWVKLRNLFLAPENIQFGASIENRECLARLPWLKGIPGLRFLSLEPLLEELTLDISRIHWVIVGGESGTKARPCNVEWIRSIISQCRTAGVPCFVKQLGAVITTGRGEDPRAWKRLKHPKGGEPSEWPADLRIREFP
jgi:protein gp37